MKLSLASTKQRQTRPEVKTSQTILVHHSVQGPIIIKYYVQKL